MFFNQSSNDGLFDLSIDYLNEIEGFPIDLSIVATLRPSQGISSILFAVYNDAGDEQLVISVGDTVKLIYQGDDDGDSKVSPVHVDFGVRMNDGKSVFFSLAFSPTTC